MPKDLLALQKQSIFLSRLDEGDFAKVREIADIGYQQSIGPLREWAEQHGLGNTQPGSPGKGNP